MQPQGGHSPAEPDRRPGRGALWARLPTDWLSDHVLAGAVAVWAVGLAVAALARPLLDPGAQYLLFTPAVLLAGLLGGARPGLVVLALAVAGRFALEPRPDPATLLFVLIGLLVAYGGERLLRTRTRGEQAARALGEREAYLRSIFDVSPDGLIVIDRGGVVQAFSKAAERMFGWTELEVVGRNISVLMPPVERQIHDVHVQRYLQTGEKRIIGIGRIVVGERKDGSTFPCELAVGEASTEGGRFFIGFIRDLTERQKAEARLQELQAELVHVTRLSAMGEMASTLAHELNQPLSAIANYLAGAQRVLEQQPGTDRRALDAVAKSSEQAIRAGDIIRRLRDFLQRGESERSLESLSKLVQEACTLALVGAKEYGVRVRYSLAPEADKVLVDRVQIQQVVVNLVRNGLDAMRAHDGPREMLVSTDVRAEDGMALVSVADTGPGLDPGAATRLFQPFVTTKSDGMGVGLSISRTIVEAHGGRIWTEPNPEGGAIFHFTVRLAGQDAVQ